MSHFPFYDLDIKSLGEHFLGIKFNTPSYLGKSSPTLPLTEENLLQHSQHIPKEDKLLLLQRW